jgi:hypothetical protein
MPDTPQERYSFIGPPPPPRSVFATKIPSSVTFTLGLLLFILPFAELKCNLNKEERKSIFASAASKFVLTNTGIGLAFGSDWKWNVPLGPSNQGDTTESWIKKERPQKANSYAIVALAMAALGFTFSFVNRKYAPVISTVAGGIAAGALIGLMIDLNKKSNDIISQINQGTSNLDRHVDTVLSLSFTPWFYITIIAMLTAAGFSYKRLLSASP